MEGAGIMNLPTDVGGPTGQSGLDSYAPLIAAQSTARDMGYPRFTRELLAAGSEIDQAEVQEFLQEIRAADIQPEDLAVLRRVVEAVFNDPNNYLEVRGQLLAEGVPEDILPETFDLEFFLALRMATEEVENLVREPRPTGQEMPMGMPPDMPVEMAEGGIVGLPQLTPIAREMAAMGRNGDTMLAHITPQEAMMLKRMGGSGTINPYTGLPEFFLKKMFRSIGRAIKKFAKSTVGRIIISVALGAFLGPAAAGFLGASSTAAVAAVSGAVGGFGSSVLAGDDLKTSLRNGLKGAVLAGGTAAITGGSAAFQERPQFEQAYKDAGGFRGTVSETASKYFDAPVDTARQLYGTETVQPDAAIQAAPTAAELQAVPLPVEGAPLPGTPGSGFRGAPQPSSIVSRAADSPGLYDVNVRPDTQFMRAVAETPVDQSVFTQSLAEPPPGIIDRVSQGAQDVFTDYLSPNRPGIQGRSADTIFKDLTLPKDQGGQFGFTSTPDTLKLATEMAAKEAPGTFTKYGPLMATGTVALSATGGLDSLFKVPEQEPGESYEAYMARREAAAAKFREERPEFFGSLAPASYPRQTAQTLYTPPVSYATRPTIPISTTQPIFAAQGSGPQGVKDFPRKNGAINGPGTGTSDDIPAMLSDGEFVFTAQAVRNMGGGSRRKGAAKMYKLMKMLEGGPVGKTAKA